MAVTTVTRRRTRRRYVNKKQAKLNQRQKKEVKRIVGVRQEKKYVGMFKSISSSSTPDLTLCTAVSQGLTDSSNRIGDSIRISHVQLRMVFNSNVQDIYNIFRVILFRWRESTDGTTAAPPWSSIINDTNYTFVSPINVDNLRAGKLIVLYDSLHQVSTNNNAYGMVNRTFYGKTIGRKTIDFISSGLTAVDHIFLYVVSNSSVLPHPTVDVNVYTYFTDS